MRLIEKDLGSVNINLGLSGSSPDIILRKLVELTEDRNKWRKIVRDIITVNC